MCSIYVPTLTHGHELWVVTYRMRLEIQAAEMSFLQRVAEVSLVNKVSSSSIWEGLRLELILCYCYYNRLRWFGHLIR